MEKILILGISSFSGASVASYLQKKKFKIYGTYATKKNKEYLIYNKKKIKTFKVNFLNEPKKINIIINKIKPDIIIDHASICMVQESWKYSKEYFKINVDTKLNIINNLNNKNFVKKYVYISTPEIFGSSKRSINEFSNKFKPSTPYAKSKLLAELNFKKALKKNNFPIIICRFSNFYGPGQPIYRLIPKAAMYTKMKKIFPLHGEGKSFRNFIYSSDFCEGIYKVIKKGLVGDTYHFSGNNFHKISKIIKFICKFSNLNYKRFIKIRQDRKGKDEIYKLDSKWTKKKLEWRPKIKLKNGLKKTIKYYKKNFKNLLKEKLEYKFKK